MCRALGGDPSLPLFRKFFKLSHNGDWYTVRNRRGVDLSCLLWMPQKNLLHWQDHFFWVSAHCIPFEMHWRQHHEPMNVIHPHTEQFDKEMYSLLVKHPTSLQQFPEHVLVMTGLSRNWPYANVEPVLKEGDEEMGLLKYIQRKGVGATLTTRDLREDELNILDRTQGIRYEGGLSHVEKEVEEGDVSNVGGGCVEIVVGMEDVMEKKEGLSEGPCSKRMKFGNVVGSNVEVISISSENSTKSFGDDTTSCGGKNGKEIVFTESSESFDEATNDALMPDVHGMIPRSFPELLKWHEKKTKREAQLCDKIVQYRVRMSLVHAKNVKLEKKVKKLKDLKGMTLDKGSEAMRMVAVNTVKHEEAVQALQKELEDARAEALHEKEKLKQAHEEIKVHKEMVQRLNEELEMEKEGRRQECVLLERVSSERQWLIKEGFEFVINRLHRSGEYNRVLGAVQSNLWSSGAHDGVVAGYAQRKKGKALEDASLYKPEAHKTFLKSVHELEHTRFPYVVAVSQCADRTIDELRALKPMEMEEDEDEAAA
ncbi:hypothetical protein QVD17_20543 [Tagetes erecta]|uniref:Transposase (Putative), gypsy type n=1 Tax=Tagetes erecta TaxID=13708 RepID=A0AAD8KPV6_TARER|nr:hypothetical protein QVD17_20543 [Tagetes erecta]